MIIYNLILSKKLIYIKQSLLYNNILSLILFYKYIKKVFNIQYTQTIHHLIPFLFFIVLFILCYRNTSFGSLQH